MSPRLPTSSIKCSLQAKDKFRQLCKDKNVSMKGVLEYFIEVIDTLATEENWEEMKRLYPSRGESQKRKWAEIEKSIVEHLSTKPHSIAQLSEITGWTEPQIKSCIVTSRKLKNKTRRVKGGMLKLK